MEIIKKRLKIYLVLFFSSILLGVLGFVIIEKFSIIDSLYFTIVTMSTVGYGDLYPLTSSGKILTIILIIVGVSTFIGVISSSIDMFLYKKDHEQRLKKLNIITGLFYSEIGNKILNVLMLYTESAQEIRESINVHRDWTEKEYHHLVFYFKNYEYIINPENIDFNIISTILNEKKDFLVRLLEHPALLEDETFTELLRAIFHLHEEFTYRLNAEKLSKNDLTHLANDLSRIFSHIIVQWLSYMRHLQAHHNYLFLYSVAINPFKNTANEIN